MGMLVRPSARSNCGSGRMFTGHGIPELRAALADPEAAVRLDRIAGPVRHEVDVPILGAPVAVADGAGCGEILLHAHRLQERGCMVIGWIERREGLVLPAAVPWRHGIRAKHLSVLPISRFRGRLLPARLGGQSGRPLAVRLHHLAGSVLVGQVECTDPSGGIGFSAAVCHGHGNDIVTRPQEGCDRRPDGDSGSCRLR